MQHILKFSNQGIKLCFTIFDPARDFSQHISKFCQPTDIADYGLKDINSKEGITIFKEHKPDIVFSIVNYQIIGAQLLNSTGTGMINFHDGPLPFYRGVNVSSWAILNAEIEHGVTWHLMSEKIDSGDIIAQRKFPIKENITAGQLMMKSLLEGANLFKEIFEDIIYNRYTRLQQPKEGSCYLSRDFPENNGTIDCSWHFAKIERMVRALNYRPYDNPFYYAKLKTSKRQVIINKVSRKYSQNDFKACGKVIKCEDSSVWIGCSDSIFSIDEAIDQDMKKIPAIELANELPKI